MRIFFDLDGTLAKWQENASIEDLYRKGYFENLPAEKELVDLVNRLSKTQHKTVYILSAYLSDSLYAREEKLAWIRKHLPKNVLPLLVPYGENKAKFVEKRTGISISSTDLLVDDHSKNCIEWEEAGGRSIKFLNGINGLGTKWNGKRAKVKDLAQELNI